MNRIAIISPDASGEIFESIKKHDIEPIAIPRTGPVRYPLSGHPDIQIFIHQGRVFCHPDIARGFVKKIERRAEIIICKTPLSARHPGDIPYNIACCGLCAFHHLKHTDPSVRSHLESAGVTMVHVNQGYAKCSTLIIDAGSIITADGGIHKKAIECALDSLVIRPGHIGLPGYEYGFIGGAAGVTGDTVFFAGDIAGHPDGERILHFVSDRGKKAVMLSRTMPADLGSIFVL